MNDRIPAALAARLEHNPFRRPNRYVDWNGSPMLAETVCKKCGVILTALGADPRFKPRQREVKTTKVRTIIQEVMVCRSRTSAFDTIEFEVEELVAPHVSVEGETREDEPERLGLHRTAICDKCKEQLLTNDVDNLVEVQYLYDADLERMACEDEVNRVPIAQSREVIARLAARRVRRVIRD